MNKEIINEIVGKCEIIDEKYKCLFCGKLYKKMGIKGHIWRYHTDEGKNFNPNRGYSEGTRKGKTWNKGLTKESDERVRKSCEKISFSRVGSKNYWFGKKLPVEMKKKISEAHVKYMENGGAYHCKWYKISNGEREISVQGTWEKKFAEYLNRNKIKWDRFSMPYDNHRRYTPDFYLPEYDVYIEVKGFMKERDINKMKKFLIDNPHCDIRLFDSKKLLKTLDSNNLNLLSLERFSDKY